MDRIQPQPVNYRAAMVKHRKKLLATYGDEVKQKILCINCRCQIGRLSRII
jgi:hypothetical protein